MNGNLLEKINDTSNELKRILEFLAENPLHPTTKYLVPYSVVRASGTIETVYKEIIFDFLAEGVKPETESFLESSILARSSNPTIKNITFLLGHVNTNWKKSFRKQVEKTADETKLNSLVELRNNFSHGKPISGTSINDVISYYNAGVEVLHILDSIVNPVEE